MDLFPTSVGTRPRLACEIRPEGVVVARGESPAGTLTAVARADLRPGLVLPSLKAGNLPDRPAVVAALRRAFDAVAARGADRSKYVTVIVPDAAVRVLLLDFDALPSKPAEALPIVRFRLKKLLPFDVEHALVSYQIMSSERSLLRVLAVAIPHEVLAEYEAAIAEAGLQPGVVLPSTLAALAGLDPAAPTALVLNATPAAITTSIVRAGVLLLHRTLEIYPAETATADALSAGIPPSAIVSTSAFPDLPSNALALTPSSRSDRPLPQTPSSRPERSGVERSPHLDRSAVPPDGATPHTDPSGLPYLDLGTNSASPTDASGLPYLDLGTDQPTSLLPLVLPLVDRAETAAEWSRPDPLSPGAAVADLNTAPDVNNRGRDLAESVSVAAAYFEDTLGTPPDTLLSAGTTAAPALERMLGAFGLDGLRVRELLETEAFGPGASTATVPPGWLAGVRGALRS